MRRTARALLLFLIPAIASAWSPQAEVRIATKAAALAPPDLKLLLDKYSVEYMAGVRDAAESAAERDHRDVTANRRGPIRTELDRALADAVNIVRERRPMRDLAYRLGTIAHFVSDANNPLRVGEHNLMAVESDYERYFDRSLRKFPTVFYGLHDRLDPTPVVNQAFARSRRFNDLLREEYHRDGRRRSSSEFDDRSTAFGIASISYSRAVSDTVNLYYYVWKEAGGDVRSARILKKGNLLLNENVR
ncbi:MAG: hypothetical protein ABR524_01040 [Thermoanaerobaculia bacterium]